MGALVVGSSVVVASALVLGLALFARRPPQPAMATRQRHRRAVTVPSTASGGSAVPAATGAEAATGGVGPALPVAAEVRTPAPREVPAAASGKTSGKRARGRRARLERDGPGPRPRVRTPWWVRIRAALMLSLGVLAVAALVGGVLSVVVVGLGLVLT